VRMPAFSQVFLNRFIACSKDSLSLTLITVMRAFAPDSSRRGLAAGRFVVSSEWFPIEFRVEIAAI
jgi:hypothetical protein